MALLRETRDVHGMMACLINLAALRDDYEEVSALLLENLRMARESGYKLAIQYSLVGLGFVAASRGRPVRAARLWGAAEAVKEAFGIKATPLARSVTDYEARMSAARSRLGEEAFAAAWEEGREMPLERAVEYALGADDARGDPASR